MARNRDNEATTKKARKDAGTETVPLQKTGTETGTGKAAAGHRNTQVGTVVKAKMAKTVVVAVERLVQHDVYRKTIKRTSTFMAHDEKGAKQGDTVRIVETRRDIARVKTVLRQKRAQAAAEAGR